MITRECWLWDVRTKHVAYEPIPSIGDVKGVANFGATATLFTLSQDCIIRQYDVSPPVLVKEKQYLPMEPPIAPHKSARSQGHHIPGTAPPMPIRPQSRQSESTRRSESGRSQASRGPATLSTIQRNADVAMIDEARSDRSGVSSPVSVSSRAESMSTTSNRYPRGAPTISSRAASGTTFSTISPSMVGRDSLFSGGTSIYGQSTMSITSSGRRSRGSRLRNEVLRSPESTYVDLFPRTRARLANMQYEQAQPLDQDNMSPDELRRRMLSIVFGWDDDIENLVRDELDHHQPGSTSAVLLSKWLGEVDSDMMAAAIASGNVSSSDWMMLALSQMGGSNMGKMGQAFVQRLLQQGDFHTSATILLGMGDREDAVEIYVERCFFMEAILLTCLIFPQDWQRQSHLVKAWGEFVVENSQQQLAIRCFTCAGVEPPLPWPSPSPRNWENSSQAASTISTQMLSPPLSPPTAQKPNRMTTKNSSLKVITSFEQPQSLSRFPGLHSVDRTPTVAPGITPIAESALSESQTPGGFGALRGASRADRTATPGGFLRQRLPSIGENPVDVTLPPFSRPSQLPTPDNSGSDLEKEKERVRSQPLPEQHQQQKQQQDLGEPPLLLSSARYDPGGTPTAKTPATAVPQTSIRTTVLPSPAQDAFTAFQEKEKERERARASSKDRRPDGLHIRMPSQDQIQTTSYIARDGGIAVGQPEHRRSNTLQNYLQSLPSAGLPSGGLRTGASESSAMGSPSVSGASYASGAKSPSASGRSIDEYISSVDAAGYNQKKYRSKKRTESQGRRKDQRARSKGRGRDQSEDRGRDGKRYVRPAKRSPSSPVPMTPEQFQYATTPGLESEISSIASPGLESRDGRQASKQPHKVISNYRSGSKASDWSQRTIRHRSPEAMHEIQAGSEASYSRGKISSRAQSPRAMAVDRDKIKAKSRASSRARSPPSPGPFSPHPGPFNSSSDETDPMRLVQANRQRVRSRQRSSSRKPRERGASHVSNDRRRRQAESLSVRASEVDEPRSAIQAKHTFDELLKEKDRAFRRERKLEDKFKKEMAAKELEARRESLLRNPEAPPILHPEEYSRPNTFVRSHTDFTPSARSDRFPPPMVNPMNVADHINRSGAASVGPYGLPATPRAMRHPKFGNTVEQIPSVPEVPDEVPNLPELYYGGGPMRDIPRSMSVPLPEAKPPPMPSGLPDHPAFHKGLRPGKRNNNPFQPLGDIGSPHRRKGSGDSSTLKLQKQQYPAGIDETLHAAHRVNPDVEIVRDDEDDAPPPVLAQLAHLAGGGGGNSSSGARPDSAQFGPPPPPPPPPQAPGMRNNDEASSLSSNSNVGAINIVLDDEPGDEANVVEVPPPPPPPPAATDYDPMRSPGRVTSPPTSDAGGNRHQRGRSESGFKNGLKGWGGRLRSTSRGRDKNGQPIVGQAYPQQQQQGHGGMPYESVPPLYF